MISIDRKKATCLVRKIKQLVSGLHDKKIISSIAMPVFNTGWSIKFEPIIASNLFFIKLCQNETEVGPSQG